MSTPEILRYTQETGDFSRMLASIPYAGFIGLQCDQFGDDLIFRLPPEEGKYWQPDTAGCPWWCYRRFHGIVRSDLSDDVAGDAANAENR